MYNVLGKGVIGLHLRGLCHSWMILLSPSKLAPSFKADNLYDVYGTKKIL